MTNITDLQAIIDVMPMPVFVKNEHHQMVLVNDIACQFFGHDPHIMLSRSDYDLYPEEQVRVFHAEDDKVLSSGEDSEIEEFVTGADGHVRTVITRKRRVRLGDVYYVVATFSDITAYRDAEAQSRYLAFHDVLTGLPNRALLAERIERALLRRRRGKSRCALLYVDLDRFKEVNDTFGHQVGDALIVAFGKRMAGLVRASDTVARLGGDEFAVLLEDSGSLDDMQTICQRILEAAAEPFQIDGARAFVSASIGIACSEAAISHVELQRRADIALYDAKHAGRACVRRFTPALDQKIQMFRRLEADLRDCLARGEDLEVHYQPLFGISGNGLTAMEALVRWRHAEFGLMQPAQFIRVAEDSGLIVPLGDFVLRQACGMMARWPDIAIAVNLSPVQLQEDDFVDKVIAILGQSGLSPNRLELEVTESATLDVDDVIRERLNALRGAGVRIVLDDFGTGYSSLTHLQKLDVDKVKIDKSFVQELGPNSDSGAIVHAITALARVLGIPVTAEGVETAEQHRALQTIGCNEVQGFLFSRPLVRLDAERLLAARPPLTHAA